MKNPFKYSDTNLRYHSLSYYFKQKYGQKVFKVSLDAGFTCPNRDGTCAYGGCTFCSSEGSGEFAGDSDDHLLKQYYEVKSRMEKKWPDSKTVAYFQAFTNTHGPLSKIKKMVKPFLEMDEVVAIDIATRPDSLTDETIAYLDQLTKVKDIWIELGLQTIHDETARNFNRGYDFDVFVDTINRLRDTNIKVCVHLLNGLPKETDEMMIASAREIGKMPIDAVKIHMLHLLTDSKMGQDYLKEPFELLTQDQYADIVASQLEVLPARVVIQRLTGDAASDKLIAPEWTKKKFITMNEIQKKLVQRHSYQGKKYLAPKNINAVNHQMIEDLVSTESIVIDATLGNGHDSYFMAPLVKKIYAFDIQEQAIKNSKIRNHQFKNITYIHDSHEYINKYVTDPVDLLVFNLGYLPGANKDITTNYHSVQKALHNSQHLLKKDSHILITFYRGHEEGRLEYKKLKDKLLSDYQLVAQYQYPYWFQSPITFLLKIST